MGIIEDFDHLDHQSIAEFIANKQEEHLHLDFKTISGPQLDRKDDRRNLAKAISGFANSDGGVIVWGVDARRNPDGIDCATQADPVSPLQLLMARLNELTSESVRPVVDGIRHRPIPLPSGDSGYAATLVPASDSGPHQAKLGEDRYFKRSGASLVRMEHFDLEDMFGRRQRPLLRLTHRVMSGGVPGSANPTWPYQVLLGINNSGRGPARAPFLAVRFEHPWFRSGFGIDGSRNEGLPRLPKAADSLWVRYGGPADFVIHPSTDCDVLAVSCHLEGTRPMPGPLNVGYEIAAMGTRLTTGTLQVQVEDLLIAALKADSMR